MLNENIYYYMKKIIDIDESEIFNPVLIKGSEGENFSIQL